LGAHRGISLGIQSRLLIVDYSTPFGNESSSEKLKPWKKGKGQRVTGKGKLNSIWNMIYLLVRRIDSQLWDNRLMQILEIDQSIDHPHKILRGV
jgi:hypothetical protein